MLKNYLKIAFRNTWKQKGYSFINILGLSLGIGAAILLFQYTQYEFSWNHSHEKAEDIYLVYKERVTPTGTQDAFDTWVPMRDELVATYPVVEKAARYSNSTQWIRGNDKKFRETVTYTDASLFEMFTLKLNKGNQADPFPELQSAVISREMAQKYFGDANPIGKVLEVDFETQYVVTGVLEPIPQNSSVQIDIAVPIKSSPEYDDFKNNWGSSFLTTYVLLNSETSPEDLEAQFPDFITRIWDEETANRTNFKLLPLLNQNNYFTDSYRYAYIHIAIALVIIMIACINFMNMATARSLERAKEVGMRKAMGAHRGQLVRQFLGEAIILSLVAVVFGILFVELALPYFNSLYNVRLEFSLIGNIETYLVLGALVLMVGLLAGSYPAFYLSKFNSAETLRGNIGTKPGGVGIRNGLVVAQFAITIVLIIGTLVIRDQVQYMKNANLGFEKENTLVIRAGLGDFDDPEQANTRLQTFKDELSQMSEVVSVSSSEDVPGQWANSFIFAIPEGRENEDPMRVRYSFMDHNFFETWGIALLEGRSFRAGSETDMRGKVIVNKTALKEFGWSEGEGKQIGLGSSGNDKLDVIGVVEDYNFQSLQNPVAPILHVYRTPDNGVHSFVSVRFQTANVGAMITSLSEKWSIVDPTRAMDYFFADENFNQQYQRQEQLAAITGSFSILAIIVACLGLLGLVSFMVRQRKKEIGVRKVLGASVGRILVLLSSNYIKLVIIGFVIAAPVAWYLMGQWLQDYAFHIDLGVGVFLLAGLFTMTIAIVVVSTQAYHAATVNPVDSLRNE